MEHTSAVGKNRIAVIRQLLREAFAADELRRFCQERDTFADLCYRFPVPLVLDTMIDQIIEYCQKRDLDSVLLAEVQQANPRQYAAFESQLNAVGVLPAGQPSQRDDSVSPQAGPKITVTVTNSPGATVSTAGRDLTTGSTR